MTEMAKNLKTARIVLKVSPVQKADLEGAAEHDGQALAAFLRSLGLRRAREIAREAKAAA
jgi:uncharacterized protein (DUF1778 family)